jgi:hypothetical protein
MKKISIYIILLVTVILQGCELETERYDAITPLLFPKTAKDADALVTGSCYNIFRASWGNFNCPSTGIHMLGEQASDIGEMTSRDREMLLYGRWVVSSHYIMNAIFDHWKWTKNISGMILAIDRIEQIDMDEAHKNRLIAELRCGIAILAHELYELFGPIPLPDLETLKNPLEEKILPRATEEEMQAFIETNLREAVQYLPPVYKKGDPDCGRFTRGTCYMVLLKFYMQRKWWDKAEEAGRELMKPEYGYGLVPRYKDIFTIANEKNEETIYAPDCAYGYTDHEWPSYVLPADYPTDPPSLVKYGFPRMSWWFIHTYEPGDQRLEVIITEYTGTSGRLRNETLDKVSGGPLAWGALPLKYEVDRESRGTGCQADWIVYRYADALTLLSEAIVRRNNTITQEAIDLLNRVRTRAGLQAYTAASFTDVRDFLDKLLMERAHELFWENCRRHDLIRDGSWVEAMKKKAEIMGQTTNVSDYYQRFPLSQTVVDEGKGEILQNPGY